MSRFFKALTSLIFVVLIVLSNVKYINSENTEKSFKILYDGDVIYNGEDEMIELQTNVGDYRYSQITVNGEVPEYGVSYAYQTIYLYPSFLQQLKKGTSVLTLTIYYSEEEDDYYSASINIVSTVLSHYNSDLIINDINHPIFYTESEQSDDDIDGLKVIRPQNNYNTYIIELEKDVELTAYNQECIITNYGYNLQIVGPHTLTIVMDHDNEYHYDSAIKTSGDFILGNKEGNFITNLIVNDPFVLNNDDKSTVSEAYTFGIWSEDELKIYNSKIIANITFTLLLSRNGAEIINSTLEHNTFANFTLNEGTNFCPTTILNNNNNLIIDNSTIKSKVIPCDDYANISMTCIDFVSDNFDPEIFEKMHIKNTFIEFEPVPLHNENCSSYFIDSNVEILIENSDINVNNSTYGIYSEDCLEFINSNIKINSNNNNILCRNTIKLTYDDEKEHIFDFSTNDKRIDFDYYYPSIYIIDKTSESFILNIPDNAEILADDKEFNINDLYTYKTIFIKTKETKQEPEHQKEEHISYKIPKTGIN